MSTKAIIFDFFGVISTEVSPFWFAERFSDEEAKRLKEEYMQPADRGDIDEDELFEKLSKLTGEPAEEIKRDFASRVKIDKNMTALIESLRGKYRIALLSNAMGTWLEDILNSNDLNRLFDTRVISSDEHIIKPEREIFELALNRLGVTAEDAIFIDDNKKNTDGASAVGICGIVYHDIASLKRRLKENGIEF